MPELKHPLPCHPSGNLIVEAWRFGTFQGRGKGHGARHYIVFFEKNGPRHVFALRHRTPGVGSTDAKERKWGCKVKEVCWSADSNILLVWIEDTAGDTSEPYSCVSRATLMRALSPTLDNRELLLAPSNS